MVGKPVQAGLFCFVHTARPIQRSRQPMASLKDPLLNVYRQSLVENKKTVTLEGKSFPV